MIIKLRFKNLGGENKVLSFIELEVDLDKAGEICPELDIRHFLLARYIDLALKGHKSTEAQLSSEEIIKQLPALGVKNRNTVNKLIKELIEAGIINKRLEKRRYSFYSLGDNYNIILGRPESHSEEKFKQDKVSMPLSTYERLTEEIGKPATDKIISEINEWYLSKGKTAKKYKNYYSAIKKWYQKNEKKYQDINTSERNNSKKAEDTRKMLLKELMGG